MKLTKNKIILVLILIATLIALFVWGGNYGGKDKNGDIVADENIELSNADNANNTDKADVNLKKDKYLTDPVPEGKPKPIEWENADIDTNTVYHCQLSVNCDTILSNLDIFNSDKLEVLPEDGVIFPLQTVEFYDGESVFNVLHREMKRNNIHMEFVMTPMYNSVYIEGINNLYEFDTGELSGWMYKVNGWFPNYGASRYKLRDGDIVNWVYTCDLGRDVGGFNSIVGDELPESKKKALEERMKKQKLEAGNNDE